MLAGSKQVARSLASPLQLTLDLAKHPRQTIATYFHGPEIHSSISPDSNQTSGLLSLIVIINAHLTARTSLKMTNPPTELELWNELIIECIMLL